MGTFLYSIELFSVALKRTFNMAEQAIESDPEILNKLLRSLGVPEKYKIVDILGTDAGDVAGIPGELKALLLVLPKDKFYEDSLAEKAANSEAEFPEVMFIQQSEQSMCVTIALIHALTNGIENLELPNGPLSSFMAQAKGLNPVERGLLLANNSEILSAHREAATGGQSKPSAGEAHHMVCCVAKDGEMFDLDSLASSAYKVGTVGGDVDLSKVAKVYMDRNPAGIQYNLMALVENK